MEFPTLLLAIMLLLVQGGTTSTLVDRSSLVATFANPIQSSHEHSEGEHLSNGSVPLFYGWFFNESIAESISIIGKKYFIESYDTIPQFQMFVNDLMRRNNITNPLEYYVKPLDPDTQLPDPHFHTTAKFCGRNDSRTDCPAYLNEVSQYLGRPYGMHLVGLFFTKNTFGIRVKMTLDEQKLFREDDRSNSAQAVASNDNETSNEVTLLSPDERGSQGFAYEPYYYNARDRLSGSNHPFYPGITFRTQRKNFHPTESRAHVTVGCAPNVEAVQTGLDLLEIIDMEVSSFSYHQDFLIGGKEIPKATLREYKVEDEIGSTAFVIYPTEEMIAEAVFDAYV